ncbi:hypothetical protein LX90_009125, partial [Lentzea flava]|nr:hypothetical protein [Lentzea flava]
MSRTRRVSPKSELCLKTDEGCSRSVCDERPEHPLLTALYVKIDDHLGRPARTGRPPRLTDAELLTLAVAQALLGIRSEARWLRFLPRHLPGAFTYLPRQSGYNKRLRAAVPLLKHIIRMLALDTDLWTDATWV